MIRATASVISRASLVRSENERRSFATLGRACEAEATVVAVLEFIEVVARTRLGPLYRRSSAGGTRIVFTSSAHRPSGERLDLPVNSSRLLGRWVPFPGGIVLLFAWLVASVLAANPAAPGVHQSAQVQQTSGPAESALVGTIERFEASARRLILQTAADAHIAFILAPDAVVRLGSHTLPAAELATHRGRKAKVRYTQANGKRTAHWVVISSDPPRASQQ
jgi:hypothetical protein